MKSTEQLYYVMNYIRDVEMYLLSAIVIVGLLLLISIMCDNSGHRCLLCRKKLSNELDFCDECNPLKKDE